MDKEPIWSKFPKNATYIEIPNELDKANIQIEELKERINQAIEYIENKWYSKNTTNINEVFSTSDWRICLLEILRGTND